MTVVFADFHPTFEPFDPVARIILQEANHHDHHSASEHHLGSVKRSPFSGLNVLVECILYIYIYMYIYMYLLCAYIYMHIHYAYLWECCWHEQLCFVGHIPICCCRCPVLGRLYIYIHIISHNIIYFQTFFCDCNIPISLVTRGWWHVPLEHPQPKGKSLPAAILSWC